MPKELYLDKPLDLQEWEANGKPIMWIEIYNKRGIKIYDDHAYNTLKLVTPELSITLKGTDILTRLH